MSAELSPEQMKSLGVALCRWWDAFGGESERCRTAEAKRPCAACSAEVDAIAPTVAAMIAEERARVGGAA